MFFVLRQGIRVNACNGTEGVNGTTSVPKSILHLVSWIGTSTSFLIF